jgi:protein gp37
VSKASKIEWTDTTWNPVRGCSRKSAGCENCYAERQAARFSDDGYPWHGFVERKAGGPRWTGKVELIEEKLAQPLKWRKPRRVFVDSMSDLFHEALPDEAIDKVFAVMALCPQHTFQVLTKRPERMLAFFAAHNRPSGDALYGLLHGPNMRRVERTMQQGVDAVYPLKNVWLGVSIEDQATADERIPQLLATPAAKRFVSAEPLLGAVDLNDLRQELTGGHESWSALQCEEDPVDDLRFAGVTLDWVIVGGESGPGARPCDVGWVRAIVQQCQASSVPVFVKQLGAHPYMGKFEPALGLLEATAYVARCSMGTHHPKGGDPAEWPDDLRVREVPA